MPALSEKNQERDATRPVADAAPDFSEGQENEAALRHALNQMEERIAERTAELQRSNAALEAEIEKRRRSEEELRHSNERLNTVVMNAPVILFALDSAGVFTLSEGKGLIALGLAPGKVVGCSVFDLYEEWPEMLNDIHRALNGEALTCAVPLGDLVFETHYAPQWDKAGRVTGVFGVSIDVTERTRTATALLQSKEAAEAANRAKSHFLANISHELRTPLNAIIGFSEILCGQASGALNEKQARYADNVLSSGRHLLNLINSVLDLSKIEAGKMELDISAFLPSPLIAEVVEVVSALAAKKRIALTLPPAAALPRIYADRNKFKQALYNLLSNAIKFTPEEGRVTLSAKTRHSSIQGLFLEIAVADTGIGVALEDQERIFAEFEQADVSYSRRQEGTGLGLALTRRIVELHGGTLTVQSEGAGQGSTFRFTLPIEGKSRAIPFSASGG